MGIIKSQKEKKSKDAASDATVGLSGKEISKIFDVSFQEIGLKRCRCHLFGKWKIRCMFCERYLKWNQLFGIGNAFKVEPQK